MEKSLTLHGRRFKLMIPNSEIMEAIEKTADRINADYAGSTEEDAPIILCTLSGAVIFFSELLQRLNFPCEVKAFKLSSYSGTASTGVVRAESNLSNVEGRRILVVEDIVDTGNTIVAMKEHLDKLGVKEVKICTMLLKPEVYNKPVKLDYVSMDIPNRFIVGFGLDYDELGRNTRDIYVLDE